MYNKVQEFKNNHPRQYSQIVEYARKNWGNLVALANSPKEVSIADQLEVYTNCPNIVAEEIANKVNWEMQGR